MKRLHSSGQKRPVVTTLSCICHMVTIQWWGEGGCTLSGGEKQRLSIARAMLKDVQIVLLDEATASLDPENEVEIQKAIDTLIKGRTVIVIAHRLKTIMGADHIVVLSDGKVEEQGTHSELMCRDGLYRKLWNIQKVHWDGHYSGLL